MRIVLVGAPGAGKGTQAKLLLDRIDGPHISSGEILRSEVVKGTEVGMKAKEFMDRGQLVPDSVLIDAMRARLREQDCSRGFLLDGFPRTVPQAEALAEVLDELSTELDAVVTISVPEDSLVQRLSGRRTCRDCGALFHVVFNPPAAEGNCDRCGGELYQRDDDRAETIRERLAVYRRDTKPLLQWYGERGCLTEVDGVGDQSAILGRILASVEARA